MILGFYKSSIGMSKVVGEYNDQRVNTLPSPTSMVDQREVLGNYRAKFK